MKSGQLVVKNHRPMFRRLVLGVLAALLVIGGAALFELGRSQGEFDRFEAGEAFEAMQTKLSESRQQADTLGEQLSISKRTQLIDKQAYDAVRNDLKQLQEEILELRSEVEFYRGIVSPKERQAGLNIQRFKIEPVSEDGLFHFELVMSQMLKNDRFVKGVVKLFVHGTQNGEPKSLDFREISPNKSVGRDFRFRYFQRMEGDVRLPEGFVARNVTVEMDAQKRDDISQNFAWPQARVE